jgi:4-amino-4-deoxy-L-arabinose transferase-like glycosyltransferase
MMISRRQRRGRLFALVLLAAILRIALALRPGLWADEIFSLAMATGHSLEHPAADAVPSLGDYVERTGARPAAEFARYAEHDPNPAGVERVVRAVFLSDTSPPLYYLLLNLWTRGLGTTDAALRLFSTLWALACFPLLWRVGRTIGGRRVAWIACVLFALSPTALYYAAEGRMYSLLWFLGLLLAWTSLCLARTGTRLLPLTLWAGATAAGLLTHYFFAFVWVACLAWLWLHPGRLRRLHLAGAVLLALAAVLPWYLRIPESLALWRVTAGWLDVPLSGSQVVIAPLLLAWSLLSGFGVWGGSQIADAFAAAMYAVLIVAVLRRGVRPLFAGRRQLLWLWLLGAVLGPVVFDLLRGTNASLVARYALGGLPAALLLAGLGIARLPRRWQPGFLVLIVLAWTPGLRAMYSGPSRPWEPFSDTAHRIALRATGTDLVVVHSIPSGVIGTARYLPGETAVTSWVPQLGRRRVAELPNFLLEGRCGVGLVKIHDMGLASPAEDWLRENASLQLRERTSPSTELLYFRLRRSAPVVGTPATDCRR